MLDSEWIPYLTEFGFIGVNPTGNKGNDIRFTGEAIIAMDRKGVLTDDVKLFLAGSLRNSEIEPGLLERHPGRKDQQATDDIISALYWSYICGDRYAQRFLQYGQKRCNEYATQNLREFETKWYWQKLAWPLIKLFRLNKRCYNTIEPGKFCVDAWVGRNIAAFAHAKYILRIEPNFIERFAWKYTVKKATKELPTNQDAKVLTWYLVKATDFVIGVQDLRIDFMTTLNDQTMGDGIGHVLGTYYGANHPNSKWLTGDIG